MAATAQAGNIDRDRYRAARDLCRRRSPDLFFAAHFTSKPRRHALFAIDALVHQLTEIMGPPQVKTSMPAPAIVSEQAAACCSSNSSSSPGSSSSSCSSGSSCCGGESIAQRREVCLSVIDHLYKGMDTGKPELDAFLDVNRATPLPREWFESMIEGLAAERSLPRYATWKRLSDVLGNAGGMVAMLHARALGLACPITETTRGQLLAWGTAMRLCDALQSVGDDHKHGRVLIPLDDLVKHRLSEKDIAAFTQRGSCDGAADDRWPALMKFELDRARNLFRGGAKALAALADEGARRAFAATGVFALRRLEKLIDSGGDPFATRVTMNAWQRLKAMPRAVRVVWEAAPR